MTIAEIETLLFVKNYISAHKKSPTFHEIAASTGYDQSASRRIINRLVNGGLLDCQKGKHRSIRVKEDAAPKYQKNNGLVSSAVSRNGDLLSAAQYVYQLKEMIASTPINQQRRENLCRLCDRARQAIEGAFKG